MKRIKLLSIVLLVIGLLAAAVGGAFYMTGTSAERPPKAYDDYMREGNLYSGNGEYAKAIVSYEGALALRSGDVDALQGLAAVYARQVNNARELDARRQIAAAVPDDVDNHVRVIELMILNGELDAAKAEAEALLKETDSDAVRSLYGEMTVEAPAFSLETGSYDEYQLLTLRTDYPNATVHYTVDGSEPTAQSPVFLDGLVISAPETQFRARAFSALGYASDETALAFTVTKPVEAVAKATSNISGNTAGAVGYYVLDKNWNDEVYNYELAQVRELYILGDEVVSASAVGASFYQGSFKTADGEFRTLGSVKLDVVQQMPFLKTLAVNYQNGLDLRPLASLRYLESLSLLNDGIDDLSPLSQLHTLQTLALGWNSIEDVSALRGLTGLKSLALWNNQITDISPLEGLVDLNRLDVSYNRVGSLAPAAGMTELNEAWINNNQITDISPLSGCGKLMILMQGGNPIADYSSVRYLRDQLNKSDIDWGNAA